MTRLAIVVVVGCLGLGAAVPADACMRKMPKIAKKKDQVDPTLRDVIAAEKALGKGDHAKAGKLARGAVPSLEQLPPEGAAKLATRAQRALALAVVRSGGATPVSEHMSGKTQTDRQLGIAWAQLVLGYQAALDQDNVVLQVQAAEAFAASEPGQDRAREILRDLANRDLMPTAGGYAILAKLESDETMRNAALTRCRDLGGTACNT